MEEMNVTAKDLDWYVDLRRYGDVHSGFGLGFERLIMYLQVLKILETLYRFIERHNNADF